MNTKGRVTIPTDMDAVPETLDLLKRWGADAIRDCDGTDFPQELKDADAKSTPPITPPARTTPGRRQTPTRSSRSILSVTAIRRAARSCAST